MAALCSSLLIVLILFVSGISATSNSDLCKAVAVLMHFFLLMSFAWMAVMSVHLYGNLVNVFGGYPEKLLRYGTLLSTGTEKAPLNISIV